MPHKDCLSHSHRIIGTAGRSISDVNFEMSVEAWRLLIRDRDATNLETPDDLHARTFEGQFATPEDTIVQRRASDDHHERGHLPRAGGLHFVSRVRNVPGNNKCTFTLA